MLYPTMPIEELENWAKSTQLLEILDIPAKMLFIPNSKLHAKWLWVHHQNNTSLKEIITRPTAQSIEELSPQNAPLEIQNCAIDYLKQAQKDLQEALLEENTLLSNEAPQNDFLRNLWDQLHQYRTILRQKVTPRPKNKRHTQQLWYNNQRNLLQYKEESIAWCGDGRWAELYIHLDNRQKPIHCNCLKGKMGECHLGLAALDQTLEMLIDPMQSRLQEHLIGMITTPKWQKDLDNLDQVLLVERESKAQEKLGWRIKKLQNQIIVEPVWCQNTGGIWKHRKANLEHILESGLYYESEDDALIASLLLPDGQKHNSQKQRLALTFKAIQKLIHHPRVFVGSKNGKSGQLFEEFLELHLSKTPLGIEWTLQSNDVEIFPMDIIRQQENIAGDLWIDVEEDHCIIRHLPKKQLKLFEKLSLISKTFPNDAISAIYKRFESIEKIIPVHLDQKLRGQEVIPNSVPLIRIECTTEAYLKLEIWSAPFPENSSVHPVAEGRKELYHVDTMHNFTFCIRNFQEEGKELQELLQLLVLPYKSKQQWLIIDPIAIYRVLETLQTMPKKYRVEWLSHQPKIHHIPSNNKLELNLFNKNQGFTIEGVLELENETLDLWEILPNIRRNQPYLLVKNNIWYKITNEFHERMVLLADSLQPQQKELFLSKTHIPNLKEFFKHSTKCNTLSIDSLLNIQQYNYSGTNFPYTLRKYQIDGVNWMLSLQQTSTGGCLADEMGLGKTIQTLAFIDEIQNRLENPIMIIAPKSTLGNWEKEIATCLPDYAVIRYYGQERQEIWTEKLPTKTCILSNYALIQRDIDLLKPYPFAVLVLDEAQYLKNPQSNRTIAIKQIQADFTLALTGTPIENKLLDLWSIYNCIIPELFGTWKLFHHRFVLPIEKGTLQRINHLHNLMKPFFLRRYKSDVYQDLPEKIEINDYITLSTFEQESYDRIKQDGVQQIQQAAKGNHLQILKIITQLRQLCCHRGLIIPTASEHSTKLDRALELMDNFQSSGKKVLIFSQFVQLLKKLESQIQQKEWEYCYLDGSTSSTQRDEQIELFQNTDVPFFLLSLKAGGVGLNLTAATEVIHLDPWWNPAVEDQASDRAHRIGQTQPVTIIRLIAKNTIEEKIVALHQSKRELADNILAMEAGNIVEDLTELLLSD